MDSLSEKRTVTLQTNPLLINIVIKCVLEYLPLKDIKQCRTVCQDWNSVATQIMNKRSTVTFKSDDRLTNFLEFYKAYDVQPFPFTTFSFFCDTEKCGEQLNNVYNTVQKIMTTLIVCDFGYRYVRNLTPFFKVATNLVRLELASDIYVVQLDQLATVKHIFLHNCHVCLDSFENRIAPLSITLSNVRFRRNNNELKEILINDYIDFSRCSEIDISYYRDCVITFDMSRDIVSGRKVYFKRTRVINWRKPPTKADKNLLPFEKHTGVGIKELDLGISDLNLSVLPQSIEKLSLIRNTYATVSCVPVDLPNLKCLIFRPMINHITGYSYMLPSYIDMGIITSVFRLCPKLVDMELSGFYYFGWRCYINVYLMPVTLKRIKLSESRIIDLVGDTVIHVDSLILNTGTFADTQKFMNHIKPKVVVVELQRWEVEDPNNEIASFVKESRNLEKLVMKIPDNGSDLILTSYKTALSTYVDDVDDDGVDPDCYAFTNEVGKSLTKQEFKMYWF